jgi:integrase
MAIVKRRLKSGNVSYLVRVEDKYRGYFPGKAFERKVDAEAYERELKDKSMRGELATIGTIRNLTFQVYFAEWLAMRSGKVSKGWYDSQKRMADTYVLGALAGFRLRDINAPDIGRILQLMREKGLKAQSILHVFNLLNQCFKDAIDYYGYLQKSPVLKQDRPKIHRVERAYLTPEDSWKLLEHCKDHYLAPAIWISILSGLRPSEIQALQWRALDFDKGQILVCAAYKRTIGKIEPYPKQKDWLMVPMPGVLMDFLLDRFKHRFPMAFAAPALKGGMLEYKKLHGGLRKLCDEAGVKRVSPHELRHSCSEIWFRWGASLEDIRRLFGHKSAETTQRYVHRTDDRLLSLAKAIARPS